MNEIVNDMEGYLTVKEFSKAVGISPPTIYKGIDSGKIEHKIVRRGLFAQKVIPKTQVDVFLRPPIK